MSRLPAWRFRAHFEDFAKAHGLARPGEADDCLDDRLGSKAELTAPKSDFRYTPESGLKTDIAACPKSADIVAKVENRTTPKISQMLIFSRLRHRSTP
jgi:hypothetical protein